MNVYKIIIHKQLNGEAIPRVWREGSLDRFFQSHLRIHTSQCISFNVYYDNVRCKTNY